MALLVGILSHPGRRVLTDAHAIRVTTAAMPGVPVGVLQQAIIRVHTQAALTMHALIHHSIKTKPVKQGAKVFLLDITKRLIPLIPAVLRAMHATAA